MNFKQYTLVSARECKRDIYVKSGISDFQQYPLNLFMGNKSI